jgi:hypothetical protein
MFQRWAKKGYSNILPFLTVLEMEEISIARRRKPRSVYIQACEAAFAATAKEGFSVTMAVAYERAADIMLDQVDDKALAGSYIQKAIEIYTRLEAHEKVDFLKKRSSQYN